MSQFIGLVLGADDTLLAVINPENDYELNDTWLREFDGGSRVVLIPRGDYGAAMTVEDITQLIEQYRDSNIFTQ